MSERTEVTWIHAETGARSELREATPGVYHVSAELMDQMMHELGHVPEDELAQVADEPDWTGHVIEYVYEDPAPCEHDWQTGVISVTIPGRGTASTDPVRFCVKCKSIELIPAEPTEEPA